MRVDEKILTRLDTLIQTGEKVLTTRRDPPANTIGVDSSVDKQMATQWMTSCLNILQKVFGENSNHFEMFKRLTNKSITYLPSLKCLGILKAAKDDYENGYLFDTRILIEAEVFDDFLEQSEELFKKGYYQPSAVIAGCVLEDGLRKLCDRKSIALPSKATIDPMNVELAKAEIYNKLVQTKITALADLRNKAAHGEWKEFTKKMLKI